MSASTQLAEIAKRIVIERGLEPEFSPEALNQLAQITAPSNPPPHSIDLRSYLWCSIDNDTSMDLDQLTYAENAVDGSKLLWVAIADVSSLVPKDSKIDIHAQKNTTSIYTPARIFPMLPDKLSCDFTSLKDQADRSAVIVKIQIKDGVAQSSELFIGIVHNWAKLTYNAVGNWLENKGPIPEQVAKTNGLEAALRLQNELAISLRAKREEAGALTLDTQEPEITLQNDNKIIIGTSSHNLARQLIEECMIAANEAMAKYCSDANIRILSRVVKTPKYWDNIVALAKKYNEALPATPDAKALDAFLVKRKAADPNTFKDLSLTVIKLLGRGEYVVASGQDKDLGHFSLALKNYTHSTAPNRRFADLIAQRQFKAHLQKQPLPYTQEELEIIAAHCTVQEDAANKVQRQVNKAATAMMLATEIGQEFDGTITGINIKGTWVKICKPIVEGKVLNATSNLVVGDKVRVRLTSVDAFKGFIDFVIVQ